MVNYSKYNSASYYDKAPKSLLNAHIANDAIFQANSKDHVRYMPGKFSNNDYETIIASIDDVDIDVIATVATFKYMTQFQINEAIAMHGINLSKDDLYTRLKQLVNYRVLQYSELCTSGKAGAIHYYEIDYFGHRIAMENQITFTKGNGYVPFSKKQSLGIVDEPANIKRNLMANNIILGLLLGKADIKSFCINETIRSCDCNERLSDNIKGIFRTSLTVRIDANNILSYEVVRNTSNSFEKLKDKIERYISLVNSENYADNNPAGDTNVPQFIVCAETLDHSVKIVNFLKKVGLWSSENPILFTNDSLNYHGKLDKMLYSFNDSGSLEWYEIPSRKGATKQIADVTPKHLTTSCIIGAGGAGNNIVNYIANNKKLRNNVHAIAINSDAQQLNQTNGIEKLQVGYKATNAFGTGGNSEKALNAINEDSDTIARMIKQYDRLCIVTGCKGFGLSCAKYICDVAQKSDIDTTVVLIKPFNFESLTGNYNDAVKMLKTKGVNIITYNNDSLLNEDSSFSGLNMKSALELFNEQICEDVFTWSVGKK